MTTAPHFSFVSAEDFRELAYTHAMNARRRINDVHLHHTFVPDQALYRDLAGDDDATGEWAGRELCQRMWRYHTETKGWRDIAQHVTVDPKGRIWLCRDWDLPPASALGHNGSSRLGPFMIETIGDFDRGRETPTPEQWQAVLMVSAAVLKAFGRDPDDLIFHNEMTDQKSCPGSSLDKAATVAEVKAVYDNLPDPKEVTGPLADRERNVHQLLDFPKARSGGPDLSNHPLGDELDECSGSIDGAAEMLNPAPRGPATRGGSAEDDGLPPAVFRRLKPHLIHLRIGAFVEDGPYATTRADVEEMVKGLNAWAKSLPRGTTPRVLIYAHGGLTSVEHGLGYAWRMHRWWLKHNVYPIFFVWETGMLETVFQLLEQKTAPGERGFFSDIDDWLVEALVRAVGRPFWGQMKVSAERAAEARNDRGSFMLAKLLEERQKPKSAPKIEIHAAGHSAGAIFQSYVMRELEERGVPVSTLSLMAPAATVDLFDAQIKPLVKSGQIGRLSVFNLDRGHELSDTTVPGYDKSLLYLVSRGFEQEKGEPILGLEDSIRRDEDLGRFLAPAGSGGKAEIVWCPTLDGSPDGAQSGATVHGAFDDDPATLKSLMWRVLGGPKPGTIEEPPTPPGQRGGPDQRLFRPLAERLKFLWPDFDMPGAPGLPGPALTAAPPPGAPAVHTVPPGDRRALCIGIDKYGGGADLSGCVADTRLWGKTFADLGFTVDTLTDGQATRDGIIAGIERLLKASKDGDIAALHYSGHGTYLPDLDGDEDDGQDEAWVPSDWQGTGNFLIDDDIRGLLDGLRGGVNCTFFIDCCHSGTSSRFAIGAAAAKQAYKTRLMKPTDAMRTAHAEMRARLGAPRATPEGGREKMRHVQFSACRDSQTAKESHGHGWFTKAATDVLAGGAVGSNADMLTRVQGLFVSRGHSHNDQDPILDCRDADQARALLAGLVR